METTVKPGAGRTPNATSLTVDTDPRSGDTRRVNGCGDAVCEGDANGEPDCEGVGSALLVPDTDGDGDASLDIVAEAEADGDSETELEADDEGVLCDVGLAAAEALLVWDAVRDAVIELLCDGDVMALEVPLCDGVADALPVPLLVPLAVGSDDAETEFVLERDDPGLEELLGVPGGDGLDVLLGVGEAAALPVPVGDGLGAELPVQLGDAVLAALAVTVCDGVAGAVPELLGDGDAATLPVILGD